VRSSGSSTATRGPSPTRRPRPRSPPDRSASGFRGRRPVRTPGRSARTP
jgi:hypothetical protein